VNIILEQRRNEVFGNPMGLYIEKRRFNRYSKETFNEMIKLFTLNGWEIFEKPSMNGKETIEFVIFKIKK